MSMYKCKICGNAHNNRTFLAREMMYGYRDTFDYLECSKCGCVQILEFPPDMSRYYPDDYYSYNAVRSAESRNPLKTKLRQLRDSSVVFGKGGLGKLIGKLRPSGCLASLSRIPGLKKTSRILDVGCGDGWLPYSLKEIGFDNVLGVDPYIKEQIDYSNGLKIIKGRIQEIDGEWDLIIFNQSFEHIPDQLDTLLAVCGLLATGGVCLINIPVASSYAWKHYGANWVALDAPRHFFLHSYKSINISAEKAGLTLTDAVRLMSDESPFWGSEQYIRDIPLKAENSYCVNPSKSIFTKSDITAFKRKAGEVNKQGLADGGSFYFKKGGGRAAS